MPEITQICAVTGKPFVIAEVDQDFYERIQVPMPTLCPEERLRRRLAWRNENHLYKRECDLCKKTVITFYHPDESFPLYCIECWWSDKWDPKDYGRDYDFSRPFFEQFEELLSVVPKAATIHMQNENCPYNSYLAFSKNTHMSAGSYSMEDCYYVRKSQYCKDCVNSNSIDKCELVANSTNCSNCYASHNLLSCRNCSDSGYLTDCIGVKDCFMCIGLRNKQYFYKNQQYSKEEYEKIVSAEMQKDSVQLETEYNSFIQAYPRKHQNLQNCENCSGDFLYNSKNAHFCFDCFDVEDSKYLLECADVKDCMDMNMHDKEIQLCYELSTGGEKSYLTKFSYSACASPHSEYLFVCLYLSDSFGCDGLHSREKHCILNKAYSPEQYSDLRARIIEHMKSTGEYGEFFPISMSPFAYNESMAQHYFPLRKEEAINLGYRWRDFDEKTGHSDDPSVLCCDDCQKQYRIIPQEKNLYRKMGLADPRRCPECRLKALFALKNGLRLFDRKCAKCGAGIKTSYSPTRPEVVYCEQCYLAEVY